MTEVNSVLKDEVSLFQVPYISVVKYDLKTMNQTGFFLITGLLRAMNVLMYVVNL